MLGGGNRTMNCADFFIGRMNVDFIYLVASRSWLEGRRRLLGEKRNRWDSAVAHATRRLTSPPAESEALHGIQQRC